MNVDVPVSLVAALVCVAGIGMAATTMGSTVETTPDDVIDIHSSTVPLGLGELREYKERLQGGTDDGDSPDDGSNTRRSDQGVAESRNERVEGGTLPKPVDDTGLGEGPGTPDQSLLDRLLALLRALLSLLLTMLPFAVGVGLVAVTVHQRDRLASLLEPLLGRDDGVPAAGGSTEWRAAPTNDVARAWYEMVTLLGVENPERKTPRECAAHADGVDPDAVRNVTEAFEQVRYGSAPVTDERRQRALDGLSRIRGGVGG